MYIEFFYTLDAFTICLSEWNHKFMQENRISKRKVENKEAGHNDIVDEEIVEQHTTGKKKFMKKEGHKHSLPHIDPVVV